MKIFRAEEDLGVSPLSAFRACGGPFVSPCGRRGHPFHRAGGSFFHRGGAARPPNGTRAGPVAAVPPAAAGPARRTRRDASLPVTAPYIYRRAKRPKGCTYFSFFQKIFCTVGRGDETREKTCSAPGKLERRTAWDGDKIFRAVGNGDEPGEETRGGTLGGLAETGRSARRHGGEKRGTRGAGPARSETRSARVPRDEKCPAERGGSGRRDVGRVRRVSARRARKGAKKRRLAPALLGWFVRSCAVPQRAVKGRGGDPVQQISAFRPGMRAEALVSSSRPTRLA